MTIDQPLSTQPEVRDGRAVCTEATPYTKGSAYQKWQHPSAKFVRSRDDGDHDDDRYECPVCGQGWWEEISR